MSPSEAPLTPMNWCQAQGRLQYLAEQLTPLWADIANNTGYAKGLYLGRMAQLIEKIQNVAYATWTEIDLKTVEVLNNLRMDDDLPPRTGG